MAISLQRMGDLSWLKQRSISLKRNFNITLYAIHWKTVFISNSQFFISACFRLFCWLKCHNSEEIWPRGLLFRIINRSLLLAGISVTFVLWMFAKADLSPQLYALNLNNVCNKIFNYSLFPMLLNFFNINFIKYLYLSKI